MPTPGPIRKEILAALEDAILPALHNQQVPLGRVTPQLRFPAPIRARRLRSTVPRRDQRDAEFPLQACWTRARLHSSYLPYFGFIYEGAADERTLLTAQQAAKFHQPKGMHAIRWQAPSALLFPSGMPRNTGRAAYWEESEPAPPMKILWVSVSSELLVHTQRRNAAGRLRDSHALQIDNASTTTLAELFVRELHDGESHQPPAQAILLAMMLCLQQNLRSERAKIANTAYSPLPHVTASAPHDPAEEVCRAAAIFIQARLHEPLTLPEIARQVGVSPAHLNRLFRRTYEVTVMRYVRRQRILAAQRILASESENVAEIAQLVGFKHPAAFCAVFKNETGRTPIQFRRHSRQNGSTLMTDVRHLK